MKVSYFIFLDLSLFIQQECAIQIIFDLATVGASIANHRAAHRSRYTDGPFQPLQCRPYTHPCRPSHCRAAFGHQIGALVFGKLATGRFIDPHLATTIFNHQAANAGVANQNIATAAENKVGQRDPTRPAHQFQQLVGGIDHCIIFRRPADLHRRQRRQGDIAFDLHA